MGERFKIGRLGGWHYLLAFMLFVQTAFGQAGDAPAPLDCSNSPFLQQVRRFTSLNPHEMCKINAAAKCDEGPEEIMVPGRGRSICKNFYFRMWSAAKRYESNYTDRCNASNAKLAQCNQAGKNPNERIACLRDHSDLVKEHQNQMAKLLMEAQDSLLKLEKAANATRDSYRVELGKYRKAPHGPNANGDVHAADFVDQRCLGSFRKGRSSIEVFQVNPKAPRSEGKIIDEQTAAIQRSEEFRQLAYNTADNHQKRAKEFGTRARSMRELENRLKTAGTPDDSKKTPENKSDITGGGAKQPQQAAASQGGGGGGSQGGGGSAGGSSSDPGWDQGGGSNSTTPSSSNGGAASRTADGGGSTAVNLGRNDVSPSGGSNPAEPLAAVPDSSLGDSGGSDFSGSGLGSSRGLASMGKGNESSAAVSSAPDGGGLGAGGGGGTSVPCLGKDCQQALSATGGQFAGAGALGGGGGFSADEMGNLDSIFGSDDSGGGGGGPGGEGMAGLDESLDGELGEGGDGFEGDLASSEDGEIGGAEGGNLFQRVRGTYTRAQKKGLVAGMTKKL